MLRFALVLAGFFVGSAALAADADNGRRLAETRCVPCHVVAPTQRRDVTDAPPFEVIARKFAPTPEVLAFSLLDPHPRMNVVLTRREAQDLAAYIKYAREVAHPRDSGFELSPKSRSFLRLGALRRGSKRNDGPATETRKRVVMRIPFVRLAAHHREPAQRAIPNWRSRQSGHLAGGLPVPKAICPAHACARRPSTR
jgi:hypothetical protein